MDWSTSFAPQVGRHYWDAVQAGNLEDAARITREIEQPLFALCTAGIDWQALWRTVLELNGIASRYLRDPIVTLDDATVERITPALKALGLC